MSFSLSSLIPKKEKKRGGGWGGRWKTKKKKADECGKYRFEQPHLTGWGKKMRFRLALHWASWKKTQNNSNNNSNSPRLRLPVVHGGSVTLRRTEVRPAGTKTVDGRQRTRWKDDPGGGYCWRLPPQSLTGATWCPCKSKTLRAGTENAKR